MRPTLQTHDLSVGYVTGKRARTVLANLNLTIMPGELVFLLGTNGAGKSTLLRTLARAQKPTGGSVEIAGRDIAHLSQMDLAKHLGLVLTDRLSIGSITAEKLVELGRYPYTGWAGLLSANDRTIARNALASVGGSHLADRDVSEMSDGERQRVMIARALAQQPDLLLLDEPTAFLDVTARIELVGMLRALARASNVAIILSSHDLELALRTADTVWLVEKDGQLHNGAPEDLIASGHLESCFSGPTMSFCAAERSFTVRPTLRGYATVTGDGDNVGLAAAVLEREGLLPPPAPVDASNLIIVNVTAHGWSLRYDDEAHFGQSFGELACCARGLNLTEQPTRVAQILERTGS
ncbi:ABC transporter ATP-binding protein [Devosia sp. MC521]|uniref:ABC transporter ATP-binding protein n=1 Tax=Devosia sp. MC521 TaxID=2759954 RepID=UPI0015FD8A3C|nr:ABC transporter ATP-binding protein [Devosia sp. MC521]MBJ6987828.1 ABC transporter ATP-binding protein [Devosia sp. MC521]QMW63734.1 ABC transporter ATP-binding protein [Devosia sp. MC521]